MIPALECEPHPRSVEVMGMIDRLPAALRALVHEFGFVIVYRMIDDGYADADELHDLLTVWRERRQDEWLQTDFVKRPANA